MTSWPAVTAEAMTWTPAEAEETGPGLIVARFAEARIRAVVNARELGIRVQNAYPVLHDLTGVGILQAKSEYRAGTLWRSDEILHAIDRFAERAGRRGRP